MNDCVGCHGEPGKPPSEFGATFYPRVPQMTTKGTDYTENQIFWIAKHGIRRTGMSAQSDGYSDQKLRLLTAFISRIRTMPPEMMRAIVAQAKPAQQSAEPKSENILAGLLGGDIRFTVRRGNILSTRFCGRAKRHPPSAWESKIMGMAVRQAIVRRATQQPPADLENEETPGRRRQAVCERMRRLPRRIGQTARKGLEPFSAGTTAACQWNSLHGGAELLDSKARNSHDRDVRLRTFLFGAAVVGDRGVPAEHTKFASRSARTNPRQARQSTCIKLDSGQGDFASANGSGRVQLWAILIN